MGIATYPEILPGLTIAHVAARDNVLIGLLVSIATGLLILIPFLILHYGLTLVFSSGLFLCLAIAMVMASLARDCVTLAVTLITTGPMA